MVISILNYNVEAINKYKQLTVELMRKSFFSEIRVCKLRYPCLKLKCLFELKCSFVNCIGVAAREDRIYS